MGTIGPRLRAAREARNLTVEQAADDTRISLRFLQALEREEFDALPAPVYVRGFLRSYANYLGLEPQSLLAELEGENGQGAAAFVRGPEQRTAAPARRAPEPARPRAGGAAAAPSEWSPEPDTPSQVVTPYEEPSTAYRPRPVPGVLVERDYNGSESRVPGMVLLAGVGAIVVLVLLIAVVALGGGGDDGGGLVAGDDDDDGATATTSAGGGGQTVVLVETATPSTTAGAGTSTPGGETPTPARDGTAEATPTADEDATGEPGATDTPSATATPTPSPQPTATSAPPTATPTPTEVVPAHPIEFQECLAAGLNDCGPGELLVICAPGGWFVDYNHLVEPYPNPGWKTFRYEGTLFNLRTSVAINECAGT